MSTREDEPAAAPSFEEMTAPLARAVEGAGLEEEEVRKFLEQAVNEMRAERRARHK